jgi:DNA polymerase elongation subunit (family B)
MTNHGRNFNITVSDQLETQKCILNRNDLLDQQLVATTRELISGNQSLLFLGNDVAQSIQKDQYELILHGITPCGTKTTLIVKGIYPYVDVHVNANEPVSNQVIKLKATLDNDDIDFKSIEVINGKNFMKYHEEQRQYMRIYFDTLKHRLSFINLCLETNVKTFSNDRSTYYRVVARDYEINLSGWNTIKSYNRLWGTAYKSEIVLSVDIKDLYRFDPDTQSEQVANSGYPTHVFKYERMIIASFDIEMIPFHAGHFPDAEKCVKDSIFMICVTFHYAKKPESLLNVNLTLKENDPLDDLVTIVCGSESCLLLSFSKLIDMVQPDFITEFNGGGFDWRNVIKKAEYFGIISDFLRNMSIVRMLPWEVQGNMVTRYYQEKYIKVDGATAPCQCKSLKMQGYINFDTLIIFKQIEPKADSHKLNECLKRCNLGSKDDLDIQEMFNIYRSGTSTEMKMVAHYCFIDTFKLQALLLKKNVIQDRREVANLSMTSIYDSFYYANGSKVRNILMNVGEKQQYKFDTTYRPPVKNPEDKFPGAFVVPPIKGIVRPMFSYSEFMKENKFDINPEQIDHGYKYLAKHYDEIIDRTFSVSGDTPEQLVPYIEYMLTNETQYPISGLDFASLYPSLIMAYNISPETLITDEQYAKQMEANGHKLQYVTFPFLDKQVEAWFIQHNNDPSQYGLCPAILIDLFAKRAAIKKILKPLEASKKHMEIEMNNYPSVDEYPHIEKYKEICFDFDYIDAKQKALKVFMNTFYGEMGNFLSFVCAVETAASVTTMGRYNLRLAKTYVEESDLNMKVYYGDSVTGDTPIIIRHSGRIDVVSIESLLWDTKPIIDTTSGKQIILDTDSIEVYSDSGWTAIRKCIRHKTNKDLFKITTPSGSVVVTEDHSLLDANKCKIKPSECKIGTKLLHWRSLNLNRSERDRLYSEWSSLPSVKNTGTQTRTYLNKVDAQKAFICYTQFMPCDVIIDTRVDNSITGASYDESNYNIQSIEYLGKCDGYVYDLETDSHHFAAGIGKMVVHNTDSLYVACNKSHFYEYDRKYFTGQMPKLEYCTELVRKTFELIEITKVRVNNHLKENNGTNFLKMAYEEVLFPVVFVSKKKYFGIPHIDVIDFYPTKVFEKGLETIKRGSSNVLKDVCGKVVLEILDINTTCDMLTLVNNATKRFFTTDWDVQHFVKTAVYRPDKNNTSVRSMIARYTADNYPQIPESNVRFKYVICKRYLWTYNDKGTQTILSIGDRMELVERVISEKIPIDLEYYFNNEITGQMARFIAFHSEFDTIDRSTLKDTLTEKERYTKIEEAMFKNAKKYIAGLAQQYSNPYQNKSALFKQTYKMVADTIRVKNTKTKKITSIYSANVRRVMQMLSGCDEDQSLANMRTKIETYIHEKCKVQAAIENLDMDELFSYVTNNNLFFYLKDCSEEWISNIVKHIRETYDYDRICREYVDTPSATSIVSKDALSEMIKIESLYVGLTDAQATIILDMISVIISKYT